MDPSHCITWDTKRSCKTTTGPGNAEQIERHVLEDKPLVEPYGSVSTPGGASGGTSMGASTLHAKGMPTLIFSCILIDIWAEHRTCS